MRSRKRPLRGKPQHVTDGMSMTNILAEHDRFGNTPPRPGPLILDFRGLTDLLLFLGHRAALLAPKASGLGLVLALAFQAHRFNLPASRLTNGLPAVGPSYACSSRIHHRHFHPATAGSNASATRRPDRPDGGKKIMIFFSRPTPSLTAIITDSGPPGPEMKGQHNGHVV